MLIDFKFQISFSLILAIPALLVRCGLYSYKKWVTINADEKTEILIVFSHQRMILMMMMKMILGQCWLCC